MTLEKILRAHVVQLSKEHALGPKMVRAMIGFDLLPRHGEQQGAQHKQPGEPLRTFVKRMLVESLPVASLSEFLNLRDRLTAMRMVDTLAIPDEVVREGARLMREAGSRANGYDLRRLMGGSLAGMTASLARIRPEFDEQQWLIAKATLGIENRQLEVLVRNGFLDEFRAGSPVHKQLIDFATLTERVREALSRWAPEPFVFQTIKDVAIIRAALRVGSLAHHSTGVLDGAVDFLKKHGQPATGEGVDTLIAGDMAQILDYLTARARSVGDVPMPKRQGSRKGCTIEDLKAVLPALVDDLYDTALDPVRGSTRDRLSGSALERIAANPHMQLRVIGAVVTLHGARTAALRPRAKIAGRAAANLGPALDGIDVTNAAELAGGLTAIRLASKTSKNRYDIHRTARDIYAWRNIVHVYDKYLARSDLPPATRAFLTRLRPASPSGGEAIFADALGEIDDFAQKSKKERDRSLQPFLADIPGFLRQVGEAQSDLEAFRDHVRAEVAAEELRLGVDVLDHSIERHFETTARMPDGELAEVTYDYTVHPWPVIIARNVDAKKRGVGGIADAISERDIPPYGRARGEDRLFENRYVVEPAGCTSGGTPVDFPLAILRLHRDYGLWSPRSCPDEVAYALKCERMKEFGLSNDTMRQTGEGIGIFSRGQNVQVRRARNLYRTFLFPLDQAYHSSLIGALQIESRAVEALRVGDHIQWNVGSGLETAYDADDNPFSVLISTPKRRTAEIRTPLNSRCEELADKLMELASERFFAGGPIPPLARSAFNGKGPEFESLMFCSRRQGLNVTAMNTHCRLMLIGYTGFVTHYMKYIWSKLSRMQGSSIGERREEHGHTTEGITEMYDVLTPDEEKAQLQIHREQAELRGQWLRGERESALPDPPVAALTFTRKRLLHDIEFLEEEGAGTELDKARADLRLLEAKLARATVCA